MHTPSDGADLARLTREQQDADRLYNDALTALDQAIQRLREWPAAPSPYDERQVTPMNERWELLPLKPPETGGWLRRIRAQAWAMVAPLFERQQAFNSAVVDHVNRNVAMHRELTSVMANTLSACREQVADLVTFETKLILYAQQITPYVDTKDRSVAGLSQALAAGLSELGDEVQKRWESMLARERRFDSQVSEVRTTLAVVHRAVQTLKHELEPSRVLPVAQDNPEVRRASPVTSRLDSYKYVAFEDEFRGSRDEVQERLSVYAAEFEGSRDVVEIGCGRGEFLELLRQRGIDARGVDTNDEMTAICRERGLQATTGDALTYLSAQPDESVGGLFGAQVAEHLEPEYLIRLLETAHLKLRTGSKIILETVNPACWYAFFSSYIRDITHVRPLHPDTLRYLLLASGFQRVDIRFTSPFPDEYKLQSIPAASTPETATTKGGGQLSPDVAFVLNENARKLNDLLFTNLDYAAIGERP
jgi:SAM-dependent methyltransferase